jgi:hypothetical protein
VNEAEGKSQEPEEDVQQWSEGGKGIKNLKKRHFSQYPIQQFMRKRR